MRTRVLTVLMLLLATPALAQGVPPAPAAAPAAAAVTKFPFKAGDKRTVAVAPENAFGQPNPQNVQVMPRSNFEGMELSEGLLIIFNDAANTELPGVVKAFDDDQVTIDFNHPLAGKTLTFEVEILEVKAL